MEELCTKHNNCLDSTEEDELEECARQRSVAPQPETAARQRYVTPQPSSSKARRRSPTPRQALAVHCVICRQITVPARLTESSGEDMIGRRRSGAQSGGTDPDRYNSAEPETILPRPREPPGG